MQIRSRSSIRTAWLIGSASLVVFFFFGVFSSRAAPTISWQPSKITETVPAGVTRTVSVSFVASENLKDVALRVVPELLPFVQVSPSTFNSVAAGQTVPVVITVATPATELPQTISGTIQIHAASLASNLARPLPVVLTVTWATYSNVQSGVQYTYPDFGVASKVDVTSGVAGGTMLDVKFQSVPDTNFVSGFGI